MLAKIVFGLVHILIICSSPVLHSPPTLWEFTLKVFPIKKCIPLPLPLPFSLFFCFCFYFSVHFWPIPIFRIDSYRPPALPPDLLTPWLATPIIAPFLLGGLLDWHPCAWLLWVLGPAPCSTMPLCQSQTAVGPSGTCHSDTPTSKSYQLCYCQYQNCFNILNVQTTPFLPWNMSMMLPWRSIWI